MIGEREKKLIRGCCLYPSIVMTAIVVDFLIGFLWLFLVMLDDMVFNSTTSLYNPGLAVYLGIVFIYLTAAVVLFVKVRSVGRTQTWIRLKAGAGLLPSQEEYLEHLRQIQGMNSAGKMMQRFEGTTLEQTGKTLQAAAAAQTVSLVSRTMGAVKRDAVRMAAIYQIKVPRAKKYVRLMVLVPVLLLIAVFLPEYAASKSASDVERERAAAVVYEIRDALESECAIVIIDDPAEEYRASGYHVLGELNERERQDGSYVSLYVGNDGLIQEVHYMLSIDIQATKEDNLERVQQDAERLHRLLVNSGAEASDAGLLEFPEPPAGFVEQFVDGSYYEGINIHDESANCSAAYLTDPEDVNNEYDSFLFYLKMGKEL